MSHQPYEFWLFDDVELDLSQKNELNKHLHECSECRQLKENWVDVRNAMKRLPIASPSEGFSHRWRLSVEARRELKEQSQLWKFFLILTGAVFVTMVVLACQILSAGSPSNWLVFAFQNGARILVDLVSVIFIVFSWVNVVPPTISIAAWFITIGLFLVITICLILAMKRMTSRRTF